MEKNVSAKRDKYRKKNFWIGRAEFFDLAEEFKCLFCTNYFEF